MPLPTQRESLAPVDIPDGHGLPVDDGIRPYVEILRQHGIETYESCQGGPGHACPEPMIRFHGERSEGLRALAVALQHQLPVLSLNRTWTVLDGEIAGATWELVFRHAATGERSERRADGRPCR